MRIDCRINPTLLGSISLCDAQEDSDIGLGDLLRRFSHYT